MTENEPIAADSAETYSGMFGAYVDGADWLRPDDQPLVFHVRKLCQQLDKALERGESVNAAKDSAYLQAIERLNKRRPAAGGGAGGTDPNQTDVFDFLD